MIDVCLLGCGGMLPLPDRFLTSLLLRHEGKNILIDCGENTQVALHLCGWSFKQIDTILITHFHGDHVLGLPGLLMTMGNNGRVDPVQIYGGNGLSEILRGLLVVCPQLPFSVHCHEIASGSRFFAGKLGVEALAVEHRVPCLAYRLSLPRSGKFDVKRAKALQIPMQYWNRLQHGEAVTAAEKIYHPEDVLSAPRRGLKITYCTDCRPSDAIVTLAEDSDLMVAEGLYGDPEKQIGAAEKGHMVFSEAATMAQKAQVHQLWLTHYSPAMRNPQEYLSMARAIFPNTYCGENLMSTTLYFQDEKKLDEM